jgi:hypothetical protein
MTSGVGSCDALGVGLVCIKDEVFPTSLSIPGDLAMNSVRTAIRTALCAAAVVAPVSSAWALTTAQVNALRTANIIYVSGSTATDAAIQAWAKLDPAVDANAPFAAGTYDLYKTATGYVLTGTARAIFGAASGQNIAIVKQTQGGSAIGIHNVAAGIAPNGFSNLTNLATFTATCGAGVPTAASNPFMAFTTVTCTLAETTTTVNPIVPNAGISDEDPTTWIGTGGVTSTDAGALTAKAGVQVPFGVIVSVPLRNALQTAEGLTSGDEHIGNVPYLTSSQVRAILSGQMLSLADMYESNAAGVLTQVDPSGSLVHICRRGDTSGSQFAANINFFGQGCSKGGGVGSIATPDNLASQANGEAWTGSAAQLADFVFAGSGTGDVRNCVAGGLGAGDTFNARVGFVSMDQVATTTTGWRFVGIDGVAPTIWNIQLQKYSWLTEDTFNSTTASLALNGGPGNHAAIFNTLQANISNVNGIAGLNAASRNSAAPADTTGISDTGLVTLGNSVLYGPSNVGGPSSPTWPAAIRAIATAGQGPNSPQSKTYPGQATNNCNGAFQSDPTG